jgi:hypothetical protein
MASGVARGPAARQALSKFGGPENEPTATFDAPKDFSAMFVSAVSEYRGVTYVEHALRTPAVKTDKSNLMQISL